MTGYGSTKARETFIIIVTQVKYFVKIFMSRKIEPLGLLLAGPLVCQFLLSKFGGFMLKLSG